MSKNSEIQQRRNSVRTYLVQNIPYATIAEHVGVSEDTITRDVKAIKQEAKRAMHSDKIIDKLLEEMGLQFTEIQRQYWRTYTTANSSNERVGALNGLTRCLGDKIKILQSLGLIDDTEKHEVTIKPTDIIKKWVQDGRTPKNTKNSRDVV